MHELARRGLQATTDQLKKRFIKIRQMSIIVLAAAAAVVWRDGAEMKRRVKLIEVIGPQVIEKISVNFTQSVHFIIT